MFRIELTHLDAKLLAIEAAPGCLARCREREPRRNIHIAGGSNEPVAVRKVGRIVDVLDAPGEPRLIQQGIRCEDLGLELRNAVVVGVRAWASRPVTSPMRPPSAIAPLFL